MDSAHYLIAHAHSAGPCNVGPRGLMELVATSLRNCSKIAPKWSQHGCQMSPGGLLEASWRSLGALKKAWSAKDGSWIALARLSGPKKSTGDRLLGAPWPAPRQVSAILGAQRLPKWAPRGVPNRAQNVTPLQNSESLDFVTSTMDFNGF